MTNLLINTLRLKDRGVISLIGAGGKTSLMFSLARELTDSGKTVLTTTTTKIFMPKPDQSPTTIIESTVDELVKKSKSSLNRYPHFSAGSMHDPTTGKLSGFSLNIINQLWQTNLFDWIIVEADGAKCKPLKASNSHEPVIPGVTTHLILVTGLDAVGKPLDDQYVHRVKLFSGNTGLRLGATIDEQSIAISTAIEIKKANSLGHPLFNIVFLNKADTPDRTASGQKIARLLQTNKNINQIITASLKDEVPVKDCVNTKKINQRNKEEWKKIFI
jgi:probable selenium-dependent hydroxylase accessory protein YqeC